MIEEINFPNVGKAIKDIRTRQNKSLRDLSKACKLSVNALSKIERGENSPTVASLHKISNALNVHITNFFVELPEQALVLTRKNDTRKLEINGMLFEILGSGLSNQKFEPFILTIPPGAENSKDPSMHAGEELVFVLQGEVDYIVGEATYKLFENDSLLFKASQEHSWRNASKTDAKLLIVFEANSGSRQTH